MPTVRPRTTQYLWEFLLELLDGKQSCPAISWVNREKGEFVLKDQSVIAELWGKVKGRPRMDKIKLGRAMRYYYKKKLLVKVPKRKAVYRFIKFDYLKQRVAAEERMNKEIPEIDFSEVNTLDLLDGAETASLPSFNEDNNQVDNTPLEDLLLSNCESDITDQQVPQSLFPEQLDTSFNGNDFATNSRGISTCDYTTMDEYNYNNNNDNNNSYRRRTSPNQVEEDFDSYTAKHRSCRFSEYDPTQSLNHQFSNTTTITTTAPTSTNHLTSLLVKNMFIDIQDPQLSTIDQVYSTQNGAYASIPTPPFYCTPGVLPGGFTNNCTRQDTAVTQQPPCFTDTDVELTLNTLKEFERMVMLSSM